MKSSITPFEKAVELIDAGNNVFITGGGGVGKSYLLNQLKKHYGDNLHLTSTTGVSAYNINGQTIHSFTGIYKNRIYLNFPDTRRKLEKNLRNCKILAIDEISMLHKVTLDSLDYAFRKIKNCLNKPFGGVQMIFIGDFFQLPPVDKNSNSNSKNKEVEYCFKSSAWEAGNFITLDLQEVKRQSDKRFISALNKVRIGNITPDVIDLFEERERKFDINADSKTLRIFSNKVKTNCHNNNMLREDPNCSGERKSYDATDYYCETIDETKKEDDLIPTLKPGQKFSNREYGIAKHILDRECRYPEKINLRNGCRVMLLKNLDQGKGLVNGSCGVVISHSDDGVVIKFDKINETTTIKKDNFYYQYRYIEDEETGQVTKKAVKRIQFPLQLAYAITIHKSQGMTFDELVVNLDRVFGNGMSYVALSRNRTLENLYIKNFNPNEIKTSKEVINFYNNLRNCITFTEDGEMIENYVRTIEVDDKESQNSTTNEILPVTKTSEPDDDTYIDQYEANEYSESYGYEYAIGHYTKEIDSNPNSCVNLNGRAEAYFGNKEYENALNDWNRILDIDPECNINYLKKAYAEYKINDKQQAIADYDKYLADNPDSAIAYNYRGLAKEYSEDYNYKEVIEDYSQAVRFEPNNCKYLNDRARAYYCDDNYEKALEDWNKVLKIDPEYKIDYLCKANAEFELAGADYENEEYEKAVDKWNDILKIAPESEEIDYFDKAYAEAEIKQYDEAIKDYTTYIDRYPDSAAAYNNRGACKYNKGYYDASITDYNVAIELDPDECIYLNNRANTYYKMEEYEKAVDEWNDILELDSEYEISYYFKADSENKLELYEDALSSINNYLSEYPDDKNALNLKITIESNLLKYNNEARILAYIQKARECLENKSYDNAYNYCEKILENDKNNEYAHLYLGAYYHYTRNIPMAEQEYKRAIEINNTFGKAYYNLGCLMYEQGKYNSASEYCDYAEKYDYSINDKIKDLREKLQIAIKKHSQRLDDDLYDR